MLHRQRWVMEYYISDLSNSSLFNGIVKEDIEKILFAINARTAVYQKNETIIWEGGEVKDIGIILSGRGRTVKIDKSGRTIIVSLLEKGSYIGVLLAASREHKSPVTVQATERLTVLLLPFERLLDAKGVICHKILLRNCFNSVAEKSMELYDRIDCLIRPTLREKIMSYLTRLSNEFGSTVFNAPLDRSAMSEYLCADRSALSRELSAMKRDGLIDYYKNSFKLYYML